MVVLQRTPEPHAVGAQLAVLPVIAGTASKQQGCSWRARRSRQMKAILHSMPCTGACVWCRDRKQAIEVLLARTAQQDAEENVVLEQAAVVEEARRKEAALRKAAAQPARPGGPSDLVLGNSLSPLHLFAQCLSRPNLAWPAGGDEEYKRMSVILTSGCRRSIQLPPAVTEVQMPGICSQLRLIICKAQGSHRHLPCSSRLCRCGGRCTRRNSSQRGGAASSARGAGPGTCSLLDADVAPHWPAKPGVYVRGAYTRQMGQQQLTRMAGGTRCISAVTLLAYEHSKACLFVDASGA